MNNQVGLHAARARLLGLPLLLGCGGGSSTSDSASQTVVVNTPSAPEAQVVFRDGDNPWTLTNGFSGSVTFAAPSGRYTVVIACMRPERRLVTVYQLTTAELSTITYDLECGGPVTTISGQFTNGDSYNYASFGQGSSSPGSGTYSLPGPLGTHDLVAVRGLFAPDRVILTRGMTLSEPTTVNLDFNASAIPLERHSVQVTGRTGTTSTIGTTLWTEGRTNAVLCGSETCSLPASMLLPGDMHIVTATDGAMASVAASPYRAVTWNTRDVDVATLALPAAATAAMPSLTVQTKPSRYDVRASWPDAPIAPMYKLVAIKGSVYWQGLISRAYFAADTMSVTLPDLSGVVGWDATFELKDGSNSAINWWLTAVDGASVDAMTRLLPAEESIITETGWSALVQPP